MIRSFQSTDNKHLLVLCARPSWSLWESPTLALRSLRASGGNRPCARQINKRTVGQEAVGVVEKNRTETGDRGKDGVVGRTGGGRGWRRIEVLV